MIAKCIIFDFDGVIVESMDIKARAFAYLFRKYPEHVDGIVKWHMLHGGTSRYEKFEYIYKNILQLPLPEEYKQELGKQFKNYVYQEVIKCPFVKGAYEFLNKHYQKTPLFIVSGTPEEEVRSIIKGRKLSKFFAEVFGSPAKKDALISKILQNYKLNPSEVLFVGDSIDDYEAAQKNGVIFIGRIYDTNPFLGLDKKLIIKNIHELEKIINT